MDINRYLDCVNNIHRDSNNIMALNYNIHNSMLHLLTSPLQQNTPVQEWIHPVAPPMAPPMSSAPAMSSAMSSDTVYPFHTPPRIISRRNPTLSYVNIPNFLDPVDISPTNDQINTNTIITMYQNISDPLNNSCPIRNEPFAPSDIVVQINTCRHIYYASEFYGWFRNHVNCPMCRCDIREVREAPSIQPSDISLNNRYHDYITNAELENIHTDPQVAALQNLTATIANELASQLQFNSSHTDLSNADIELSLSFGSSGL